MKAMAVFLENFMEKLSFPREAAEVFLNLNALFEGGAQKIKVLEAEFEVAKGDEQYKEILGKLSALAGEYETSPYTMHLYFYMRLAKKLKADYESRRIPLEIFWNSMDDLRCKLYECRNLHDVWGTFVGEWFPMFYTMERFGIGRFQYEYHTFPFDYYEKKGFALKKGDRVYNLHIPSSGSLTAEKRMSSYKAAYEFFRPELGEGPLVLVCHTWLFYHKNDEFFPPGSNIIDFKSEFDIIDNKEQDVFEDSWRIFGKDFDKPPHLLPTGTSLQKAFANWFKAGGKAGEGFGVMAFDGERILR